MWRKKLQKGVLAILTVGILIIGTIAALLLVRGNTITSSGISETGTVRLQVSPATQLSAFLDEQPKSVTSNNTLENVQPGTYQLRITKEGYTAWQQEIKVEAGLVTDVSVKLFPEELKLSQITQTNIGQTIFTSDRRRVFYVVSNSPLGGNVGIWQQSLVKSNIPLIEEQPVKITNITEPISTAIAAGTLQLTPSSNGDKLLLKAANLYYLLDTNRYNEPSNENMLNFSYQIDSIQWLRDNTNLVIKSGEVLVDYEVSSKKSTIITYTTGSQPVYALQQNSVAFILGSTLYRYNNGTTAEVELENITLPQGITAVFSGRDISESLLLNVGNKLYFLYITESFLGELGEYTLVSQSPNGLNLLVQDASNKFLSLNLDISLTQGNVKTAVFNTALGEELNVVSIHWDGASNFFSYRLNNEADKLYSADQTGNNVNLILQSENLPPISSYNVLPDASGLIILLRDTRGTTETDVRQNLYELKLIAE